MPSFQRETLAHNKRIVWFGANTPPAKTAPLSTGSGRGMNQREDEGMTRTLTITEALAELKTLEKRIQKKREFVNSFLYRQEQFKDPLEKQGGSYKSVEAERQAITDLENNIIAIRAAIQVVNSETTLTIEDTTRSITGWLIWRRDVAPKQQEFLRSLRSNIDAVRKKALSIGASMVTASASEAANTNDVIVNLDERDLAASAETLENVLGVLDGQLSLKNATVTITV